MSPSAVFCSGSIRVLTCSHAMDCIFLASALIDIIKSYKETERAGGHGLAISNIVAVKPLFARVASAQFSNN